MKKNCLFIFAFVFSLMFVAKGQNQWPNSSPIDDIISNFKRFPPQQLFDMANYYHDKNSIDTALILFSLVINTSAKDSDIEHQRRVVEAYNKSALNYQKLYDYRTSYEFLIKALTLCEKIGYDSYRSRIYNNIGNIYYRFSRFDLAKSYYTQALSWCQDTVAMLHILNNLGTTKAVTGNIDSAFLVLNSALKISRMHNNFNFEAIMNNLALAHYKAKQYDSAFFYLKIALNESKENRNLTTEALYLANFGHLFFELNKIDSTLHYISLSNAIAKEHNLFQTLSENYLVLSRIEKSKGRHEKALEYFEMHAMLKDSVFGSEKFGEINQLQHLYEISIASQQIEQLFIETKIKEQTIHLQQIIHLILLGILLSVSGVLLFVFFQKRKLNRSYKVLFEKNLEIIDLQNQLPEKKSEKYRKNILANDKQNDLLDKILNFMDNSAEIYDTEFSLDRLARLLESNQTHVSYVVNSVLNKNFRSFLNNYRIQQAQRLFSDPGTNRYTIEAVALMVGFKSRHAFREAFKEVVGVSPNFYLKSMIDIENEYK